MSSERSKSGIVANSLNGHLQILGEPDRVADLPSIQSVFGHRTRIVIEVARAQSQLGYKIHIPSRNDVGTVNTG